MVCGLYLTCNIANIKINLPTVAGPPPLHYLPPWTPTTTYYSFLLLPDPSNLSFCCICLPILLIPHSYLSPPFTFLLYLSFPTVH